MAVCQLLMIYERTALNVCSLFSVLAINIHAPFPLRSGSNGNGFVRQQFLLESQYKWINTGQVWGEDEKYVLVGNSVKTVNKQTFWKV